MHVTTPNRVSRTYVQRLVAGPSAVFPLLCPVREADWLDGWDPDAVITRSGVAEADCVFVTAGTPNDAIWYVTQHDPEKGFVEMLKITPLVTACRLTIQLRPTAAGSEAVVTYTHTSLGPEGDAFVAAFTAEYYRQFMQDWEARVNHYLATGTALRAADPTPPATPDRDTTPEARVAMQVNDYRSLVLHMEWADARIWTSALSVPSLSGDQPIRERLHHFHCTQWAYLQVLRGLPVEIPECGSFADLPSIGRWARQFYRELPAYLDGLDDTRLRQDVEFPWAAQVAERLGSAGPATVGESLLQLVLHTTHHRGQVATRIRESGGEPPLTDFIAWVWTQRPVAQWGSLDVV